MQKTISNGVITDRASYHIVNQYGWEPRACFEILYTLPGFGANESAALADIEATLWQTVNGRVYHYYETLLRDYEFCITFTIYFEHQEDALLFKLAAA